MLQAYADRWALVTGASSGIGAEFARRLAARGMHLVIVARRKDLMEDLAKDLHTRHGTKCEIISADLSDAAEAKRLFEEVERRGITIDLLVNNAGFGWVGKVDDTDVDHMLKMVRLNIGALTELTFRFLPGMLERQSGAIINVSSVAAFQPVAFMPAYSASKAFVLHFSEALWAETQDRGVTVMALCPGTTETEFFDVAGVTGWLKKQRSHPVSKVVKTALKALDKGRQYIVPGWKNYLVSLSGRLARRKEVVRHTLRYFRPNPKTDNNRSSASQDSKE